MAFNPAPSVWFGPGFNAGTSYIQFNTDNAGGGEAYKLLKQLTNALANPSTGDVRAVMMAVVEEFFQAWLTIAIADRPKNMTISRTVSTGTVGDTNIFSYNFRFTIEPNVFTAAAES
jgi:hypothetical protein